MTQQLQLASMDRGKTITAQEEFMKKLNTAPPANEVKVNKAAGNSNYLPISFVQMKLDEIFIGLWSFEMDRVQVVANEIIGYGTLTVVNPVFLVEIKRSGSAAVMIQMAKDSDVTDYSKKLKNTLVKDFPHLQAECLKSAAKTLGKVFGRDLNRQFTDDYTPEYTSEIQRSQIPDEVKQMMTKAQNTDELVIIWDSLDQDLQQNPELKKLFSSRKAELNFK